MFYRIVDYLNAEPISSMNSIPIPRVMSERISPVIASPLGLLKTPMSESKAPANHRIQPRTGTHERSNPNKEVMKPAVPSPFDL